LDIYLNRILSIADRSLGFQVKSDMSSRHTDRSAALY